jgi:hypothetical protein
MRTSILLSLAVLVTPLAVQAQGGGVRPMTATYSGRSEFRGETQGMGMREITVSEAVAGGHRAWLVVHRLKLEQGLVDSVLMRADDLSPLSRRAEIGRARLTVELRDGELAGQLKLGDATLPLSLRPGERSFLNYHALRAALAAWPLAAGWRGTASVLQIFAQGELTPLTLEVTGEERIRVPAGEFDCWVVHVTGPRGLEERWWVSKAGHHMVRSREPIGRQGAILQLDLVSITPAPQGG